MKKIISLMIITVGALIISGCNETNTAQPGDRVSISYTATLPDGTVFKTTSGTDTLDFIVGQGEVIKGLDESVVGMKIGKTKTLNIKPEEGYGSEYSNMKIQKVPKTVFDTINIQPKVGEKQNLGDLEGIIKGFETDSKGYEYVLFDLNPPYTTQTLTYNIKIENLVKATPYDAAIQKSLTITFPRRNSKPERKPC